jgi:class 3 adenylate cyclase
MHREFLDRLGDAEGESKLVIAANVDVRGFSRFSLEVDSVETALFVKKVYRRILESYFVGADFFKPTGDGLLLVFAITEESLQERANELVRASLALVAGFADLLRDVPIVNFPVPDKVGIGLARGAACRLVSGELTLDYSGTVLNLASRLMELARPSGVVFDGRYGVELLADDLREQFVHDEVYLRSLAEKIARPVWYSSTLTTIAPSYRRPVDDVRWKSVEYRYLVGDLKDMSSQFRIPLPSIPLDPSQISVAASYPIVDAASKRPSNRVAFPPVKWRYETEADETRVALALGELGRRLEGKGIGPELTLRLVIKYPER